MDNEHQENELTTMSQKSYIIRLELLLPYHLQHFASKVLLLGNCSYMHKSNQSLTYMSVPGMLKEKASTEKKVPLVFCPTENQEAFSNHRSEHVNFYLASQRLKKLKDRLNSLRKHSYSSHKKNQPEEKRKISSPIDMNF